MPKKIYIIAGEDSGDNLGAKLIRQLKESSKHEIELYGIGGPKMAAEGLHSIFPMKEISLIGFIEIIPHMPNLLARIRQTIEHIKKVKPDILVTIDSPGFNKKIAKAIKEQLPDIKRVHYVAPTVWAYKPQRAKKMAELFHHLLVLLPFEPPYFIEEGLPTTFTGHPVFEDLDLPSDSERPAIRHKYNYTDGDKVISLLVGSRAGEVKRLLPIYIDVIKKVSAKIPSAKFVFLATANFEKLINNVVKDIKNVECISDTFSKKQVLSVSDAAIVKSGTISLEVAAAKVPMIITYKVSPLSAYMLRRMIKVKYVTLLNIVSDKAIIPELLQEDCTAENLSAELLKMLEAPNIAYNQLAEVEAAFKKLKPEQNTLPSKIAAETILKLINN